MNSAFIPIIGSVIRHFLTAGGGAAVGAAAVSENGDEVQALAGAIATIIGFMLSYMEKRKRKYDRSNFQA